MSLLLFRQRKAAGTADEKKYTLSTLAAQGAARS